MLPMNHLRAIMRLLVGAWLGGIVVTVQAVAAEWPESLSQAPTDPIEQWGTEFHTSVLWKFGSDATPLSYTFLPQMLVFKSPPHFHRKLWSGDLYYRVRTTLLLEPIVRGPESYFAGVAFSPSLEWRNASRRFTGFFSAGGGVGWMDARGHQTAGAQGQDFNLNWFVHVGGNFRCSPRITLLPGLYFQHISNGGMNKINPGVNAMGPTLGLAWEF